MLEQNNTMQTRVEELMKTKIQPQIQMDGGDIELVKVDETSGTVSVRLGGACIGCPLSSVTLMLGVERELLENIPEFTNLEILED